MDTERSETAVHEKKSACDAVVDKSLEKLKKLTPRAIRLAVESRAQKDGDGATVYRSIGTARVPRLDPFLMLDEFRVKAPAGFPSHPHRGFETVTYMLNGAFTHEDFCGHKGTIEAGDLQWMTAGRGIIHSEMPAGKEENTGLQLWVNLPKKDKMIEPNYQELKSKEVPEKSQDGVKVRVIAGESMGVKSAVYTRTPIMYLDFTLQPGARFSQPVPASYSGFIYTIDGSGVFGKDQLKVGAHHCLVLDDGDEISFEAGDKELRLVLIAGEPINEPVVQHGPFVMNTREEIYEAFADYEYGRNGFERGSSSS